jgi:hypothetical protein
LVPDIRHRPSGIGSKLRAARQERLVREDLAASLFLRFGGFLNVAIAIGAGSPIVLFLMSLVGFAGEKTGVAGEPGSFWALRRSARPESPASRRRP